MYFKILFKSRRSDEYKPNGTLCVQNIAHKNEALLGYVSPRVGPRELYRLEIALKIIITVPSTCMYLLSNLITECNHWLLFSNAF